MKFSTIVGLFTVVALVGCDELKEKEIPYFKTVDGKVATQALASTIGEVVGELDSALGQTGGNITPPNTVRPPEELFEEEETAATPAPGLRPLTHEERHLSAWQGPEAGPDGQAGWYFREMTDTVWDWVDNKEVVARWRYWLRFEPAHDVTAGLENLAATHTNYAWTSEAGPWSGWKYLVRFGVTQVSRAVDGSVSPGQVEGTWLWEILQSARAYRGSRSDGNFKYVFSGADFLEGHHRDDDEDVDIYGGLAVNESRSLALTGSGNWSYTGQHADDKNVIVANWYGGGEYTSAGTGAVTRTGATTLAVNLDWNYNRTGAFGQGTLPDPFDFTTEPEFAKDVTPAGDAWAIPKWVASVNTALTARDGLLYWYTGTGSISADVAWDAEKVKAADDKNRAAQAVLEDPASTQAQKDQAKLDIDAARNERNAAYSQRDSIFRSKSRSLTWNGQENDDEWVSCSDPSLASDCPAEEQ